MYYSKEVCIWGAGREVPYTAAPCTRSPPPRRVVAVHLHECMNELKANANASAIRVWGAGKYLRLCDMLLRSLAISGRTGRPVMSMHR